MWLRSNLFFNLSKLKQTPTTHRLSFHTNLLHLAMNPKSFAQFQVAKSHKELGTPEVSKSNEEWQKVLTKQQYEVTRNHGTERAYTGEYEKNKQKGMYNCIGCGAPLFKSDTKFGLYFY